MKTFRNSIFAFMAIVLSACDNTSGEPNTPEPPDNPPVTVRKLAVKGLMCGEILSPDSPTILDDNDISKLNTATNEIIFDKIKPAKTLTAYDSLIFMLSDEFLFAAAATTDPNFIFPGCLFIEQKAETYRYFYYPDEYTAAGWQTLIEHMTESGRTFQDESYRPVIPDKPNDKPYPPFEEPDTGSIASVMP